jgi:hypothetical protein
VKSPVQPPLVLSKEQVRHFVEMFFVGCVGVEEYRRRLGGRVWEFTTGEMQ